MKLNGEYKLYMLKENEEFSVEALRSKSPMTAEVPCNVENVLVKYGLISDPYTGNPADTEKFELNDWVFEKKFTLGKAEREKKAVLKLGAVDAVFEVFLNGVRVGEGKNALAEYTFAVTDFLRSGENTLLVHIFSAVKKAYEYDDTPITVPTFSGSAESLNIRKAAHAYGWDILPRIVSAGITRDVELIFQSDVDFGDIYLATQYADKDVAFVQFFYNITMPACDRGKYRLDVTLSCKQSAYSFSYDVTHKSCTKYLKLQKPLLWWPNGMGEQNLYDVSIKLMSEEEVIASRTLKTGVRYLELKRTAFCGERDAFCFYINGKYFKCLGSNIVPPDVLHSAISGKYRQLVNDLRDSHTNMVRVWGGGVYFEETFFELCDEAGIVVWQDFMLSCHSYPITEELKKEVYDEAEKIVKKYRNHPSLGLYCGSNETDWPFYCTGIDPNKDVYTRKIIPKVLFRQDPNRPYLPSSPYFSEEYYHKFGGRFLLDSAEIEKNRKELSEEHYWWHRENYRAFSQVRHNFVSEIGYSGCPSLSTVKAFSGDNLYPLNAKNPFWTSRNYTLEGEIEYGVKYYFADDIGNIEDFITASQIYQAEAYKFLIEQTRAREKLNGVLLWTFNEGYPSFTSGLIDYYGDKKLAWYYVRNSQKSIQTIVTEENGALAGRVSNLSLLPADGFVTVYDENGTKLGKYGFSVNGTDCREVFRIKKETGFLVTETAIGEEKFYNHFSVQRKYEYKDYKKFLSDYKYKLDIEVLNEVDN